MNTSTAPKILPDAEQSNTLNKLKKELLHAELRLAKARATITVAEIDIEITSARLKAFAKS